MQETAGALQDTMLILSGPQLRGCESFHDNEKTPENPGLSLQPATAGQSGQFCGLPPRGLDEFDASASSISHLWNPGFSGAAECAAPSPETSRKRPGPRPSARGLAVALPCRPCRHNGHPGQSPVN